MIETQIYPVETAKHFKLKTEPNTCTKFISIRSCILQNTMLFPWRVFSLHHKYSYMYRHVQNLNRLYTQWDALKVSCQSPQATPKISHILGRVTSSAWINKPCVIALRKQWWASHHHVQLELFYMMRIIGVKNVVRRHERQLLDVHKQAPDVLSGHRCHVNYVSAVSEHPQVTGVYSFEAIPTEGAGLRSWAPATQIDTTWFNQHTQLV
jgi:alpha-amylase/alpha-mannosidase (GH57 family)